MSTLPTRIIIKILETNFVLMSLNREGGPSRLSNVNLSFSNLHISNRLFLRLNRFMRRRGLCKYVQGFLSPPPPAMKSC